MASKFPVKFDSVAVAPGTVVLAGGLHVVERNFVKRGTAVLLFKEKVIHACPILTFERVVREQAAAASAYQQVS